ncbi:MAG TPA: MFS transporter [Candidatus Methylomirabilis sp.]
MSPPDEGAVECRATSGPAAPLFTRPFVLICLATGFFYLSFYLILPVMPLYVASLGGSSTQIGLIIGLFAFVAMFMRPLSGWLIDTRGNRKVLVAGIAIFLLASLGYLLTPSVQGLLALRIFHGVGMGLFPTAATVVIAELAPPARRGEAMGWFGIANSISIILGPVGGLAIVARMGYTTIFLVAAGVAALGLVCIWLLPLPVRKASPLARLPRPGDVFSRAALLPSAILLCLCVSYGAVIAFIPIVAKQRGLTNPGLFFTVYAAAMLLVRSKAGEISDRRGRAAVILPGMVITAVSLVALGLTSGPTGVLLGAAVFGVGFGCVQPALTALTADRVAVEERGKSMGTFYTAWELGIAAGAVGSGWILNITNFSVVLMICAVAALIGAALSLRVRPARRAGAL